MALVATIELQGYQVEIREFLVIAFLVVAPPLLEGLLLAHDAYTTLFAADIKLKST
jgi:hypothetical protein